MKKKYYFTPADIEQMQVLGLTPADGHRQLDNFRRGPNYLRLIRPCSPQDGIRSFTAHERRRLMNRFETEASQYRLMKFVPASGAASRMFADWYEAFLRGGFGDAARDRAFFADLRKMPFFSLLEENNASRSLIRKRDVRGVLNYIFFPTGLGYDGLAKALIPFHAYRRGEVRTALEEHLAEAAGFIASSSGICRLHFTVSTEHRRAVRALLKSRIPEFEKKCGVRFKIDLSVQSKASSMIAADENDQPLRDDGGRMIFRPGGHGALIENLQALNADFIFIKNIDNVVPDALQKEILPYRKMLGGLAFEVREAVFGLLRRLERDRPSLRELRAITDYCRSEFNVRLAVGFSSWPAEQKIRWIRERLNRPIRICGMVQNSGEPGGGPFWVREKDKSQTLQIVESGHVDSRKASQMRIWSQASYFNPVDMVCSIRDYRGEKFKLADYVDPDAYIVSLKTEKGRKLKAQELPGLWNGGMAYWNTVFVELPLAVFNPVKTVSDLLRVQHIRGGSIK